jgi:hypothetical protein
VAGSMIFTRGACIDILNNVRGMPLIDAFQNSHYREK